MTQPESGIANQVSNAAIWSYAGNFADRALRFIVFVIVARMITPADFGLIILSLLTIEMVQAVLDAGIATALVQQRSLSPLQIDTAFFITLGVSALTSIIVFVLAPLFMSLVHAEPATPYLRALAVTPVINGAGAVQFALIQREIRFKALAGRVAGASLAASAAAILTAAVGLGAWALVARTILSAICGTVIVWWSTNYRPEVRFDLNSMRAILPMGLRLWLAGLANQINNRGFDLLAGVFLGSAALAALRVAGQTVMLLVDLTLGPLGAVGYAVLSRHRDDPRVFEDTLGLFANLAALIVFPAFAGLLVTANVILPMVFGSRWDAAAVITPYMCAVGPALYWYLLTSVALFASGRSDRILHWALVEAGLTVLFGLMGARYGLIGLASAGVLRLYVMAPLGWFWVSRDCKVNAWLLLWSALPSAGSSVLMAVVVTIAKVYLTPLLSTPLLGLSLVAIGLVTYGLLIPLTARRLLSELLKQMAHKWPAADRSVTRRFLNYLVHERTVESGL